MTHGNDTALVMHFVQLWSMSAMAVSSYKAIFLLDKAEAVHVSLETVHLVNTELLITGELSSLTVII